MIGDGVIGDDSYRAVQSFPGEPAAVASARDYVRAVLGRWGLAPLAPLAILLVSELATNAVVHAGTGFEVRVYRSGPDGILVELSDGSPLLPVRSEPPQWATGGRGLLIVDTLAARAGIDARTPGKVVWFELHGPDGPSAGPGPGSGSFGGLCS